MKQNINITEVGKKYLQLFNINSIPHRNQQQILASTSILPKISSHQEISHRVQLRQLPFRLNQLYKNQVIKKGQAEAKERLKCIKQQLLKDLGYQNDYTKRRANQLATKLYGKIQDEKISMIMELSKSRNYLSRINFLHNEREEKYQSIKRSIEKIKNKQEILE